MKGKSPTKAQSDYHNLLVEHIGCIACWIDTGERNHYCSIHHCDGRTKPDAHWLVLAPCAGHHQKGTGAPGLLAIHGDKPAFVKKYGTETELRRLCVEQLIEMGIEVPARVLELSGLQESAA